MTLIPHSYHYILTRSHPAIETAQAFWATLIPHGLHGGALAHVHSTEDGDDDMSEDGGWTDKYTQWWFDYLNEKGGKGISKDTWIMVKAMFFHAWHGGTKTLNQLFQFTEFVKTIDSKFDKYDLEGESRSDTIKMI